MWHHEGWWGENISKTQQAKDSFPEHIDSSKKLTQKRMEKDMNTHLFHWRNANV